MSYVLITANRNYSSWSLRPWLLMREAGIPFEDRVELFSGRADNEQFRRFSPTAQVPVLIDGDRTVWDSLGITIYLGQRHAQVWPEDNDAAAWAMSVTAEMHSGFSALRSQCSMNIGVRVKLNPHSPALSRDIDRIRAIWSEGIERFGGPYLAGSTLSAADAFFAPVAFRFQTYGIDPGPVAGRWLRHALALPGMQEWERMALAETARDEAHESELLVAGELVEDRRAR